MVLRVVDPTGTGVGKPRWRFLQHHRDRLLLLSLRCDGEILRLDLTDLRCIPRERQRQQATDQALQTAAIMALSALAQENRLDVFRLLVQAGPDGMSAGAVSAALKLAPNTLTFHFDRLRDAGLVTVRRKGRSMIYAARFETMNELLGFLSENCCQGAAEVCAPADCKPVRRGAAKRLEPVR
jgi:DNA-binding transcriptional ArsR family regulator